VDRDAGSATIRIGKGIDVHPFCEGRPLLLGGEKIAFPLGLAGHSDADVLLHAICDALLGAAALGDIGLHFPDSDPANCNRSSLEILSLVARKIAEAGFSVSNVDTCVLAAKPKISPYYGAMRQNIARAIGVDDDRVSVKATTTEELGFIGRAEGIAAEAVCLLTYRRESRS
jgi:2-C-methyl-D-erythritol 2,4-cyclodiphosphate synthase